MEAELTALILRYNITLEEFLYGALRFTSLALHGTVSEGTPLRSSTASEATPPWRQYCKPACKRAAGGTSKTPYTLRVRFPLLRSPLTAMPWL